MQSDNQSNKSTSPPLEATSESMMAGKSLQPEFSMKASESDKINDSNNNSNTKNGNYSQQFCLRWNNYQTNLTSVFDQLLQSESFVDVTLACDGQSIKAHKIVLSACSPYFQALFQDNPCQHPIIIMRDVAWPEMKAAVEFMYKGEINVSQDQIGPLLKIAEMLQIRGLAEVNGGENEMNAIPTTPTKNKIKPSAAQIIPAKKSNHGFSNAIDIEEQISQQQKMENERQQHSQHESKKPRITPRDWEQMAALDTRGSPIAKTNRKRRWPSHERSSRESPANSSPDHLETISPITNSSTPVNSFGLPASLDSLALHQLSMAQHSDEMEIKPGIADMIREEERVSSILIYIYVFQTCLFLILFEEACQIEFLNYEELFQIL